MGISEKTILEQARQQRGPIPQRILDAPELELGLEWAYQSYAKLTTCRSMGMECPGPIPWTAINDFCIREGISGDEQDELEYLIGKMDEAYLKYVERSVGKSKSSQTRTPLKGATTPRRR